MADIKVTATVRLRKEDSGYFIDATLDAELAGGDQQQPKPSSRRSLTSLLPMSPLPPITTIFIGGAGGWGLRAGVEGVAAE